MTEQTLYPVQVENLGLEYRLARNKAATSKEFAISLLKRQIEYESLHAVKDISFDVPRGTVYGIIGANGAGKSTLLKVIAGIFHPTSGRVVVRGLVSPMIEVSGGLNVEMSGQENIVLLGTLLGRSPGVMKERIPDIAAWAGLENFMDVPVRSYSSGMKSRLGFAVATDIKPDVLLIDEILAVGDEAFKIKSLARIGDLMEGGTTVVMVSHSLKSVTDMADTVMWMDRGVARMVGSADEVVPAYRSFANGGG